MLLDPMFILLSCTQTFYPVCSTNSHSEMKHFILLYPYFILVCTKYGAGSNPQKDGSSHQKFALFIYLNKGISIP